MLEPSSRRNVVLGLLALGIGAAAAHHGLRGLDAPDAPGMLDGTGRDFGNFRAIYGDPRARARFKLFLANVFHLYSEDALDALIAECVARDPRDPAVFRQLAARLYEVDETLGAFRYALPALAKQKREMAEQTVKLLGAGAKLTGYLELGSHGRYHDALRDQLRISGPIYTTALRPPTHSPEDVVDRGALGLVGTALPWNDYAPLPRDVIAAGSLDFISVYIGLHHAALHERQPYIRSLHAALSKRGKLVIRDHDVVSPELGHLVGLAHDVFNAGTKESWAWNQAERRNFYPLMQLVEMFEREGFRAQPERLLQAGDPTMNTLLCFSKA